MKTDKITTMLNNNYHFSSNFRDKQMPTNFMQTVHLRGNLLFKILLRLYTEMVLQFKTFLISVINKDVVIVIELFETLALYP